MINTLKVAIVTVISLFIFSAPVLAVDVTGSACKDITGSAVCKDAVDGQTKNPLFGPEGILTRAINVLSFVIAIIAVIVIIVAGIRFMLSQGEPQKITSARNTIIYAGVGLAVAALAQAIVQLVLNKLT